MKAILLNSKPVFIVSDSTGITAEKFAASLLAQFKLTYHMIRLPFTDSIDKAHQVLNTIQTYPHPLRPLIFSTLVEPDIQAVVHQAPGHIIDLFGSFIAPLEQELHMQSQHVTNQAHHIGNQDSYEDRMQAIQFSLQHDDGQSHQHLDVADIILVGISRSGKTPTSLYLAMQHGLKAANYPLIPEDLAAMRLPSALHAHQHKLFGLMIEPERLASIRAARRPNSRYAHVQQCIEEVNLSQRLMKRHNIPYLNTTHQSIEEIAAKILQKRSWEPTPF